MGYRSRIPDVARCREIADVCTLLNVRKASRVVSDLFDQAFRPLGLRGTQFTLLLALALGENSTLGQLADTLVLDRTTLTRNLGPLERDRLVASASGNDRRERLLRLTPLGRRTLAKAIRGWEGAQRQVTDRLGEDRLTDLTAGWKAVVALAR
ncbi:MAG: MarR family winged helix-turn-helix transcriptional regulator [bacterium]